MRIILVIALCLCFNGLCFADEVKEGIKPAEPTEISITNEEKLTIENIQLKQQLLQVQLDSFVKQLVAKYKIDIHNWSYDPSGKFIKSKQSIEK